MECDIWKGDRSPWVLSINSKKSDLYLYFRTSLKRKIWTSGPLFFCYAPFTDTLFTLFVPWGGDNTL